MGTVLLSTIAGHAPVPMGTSPEQMVAWWILQYVGLTLILNFLTQLFELCSCFILFIFLFSYNFRFSNPFSKFLLSF